MMKIKSIAFIGFFAMLPLLSFAGDGVRSFSFSSINDRVYEGGMPCGFFVGFNRVVNNIEGGSYGRIELREDGLGSATAFNGSEDFKVGAGVVHSLTHVKTLDRDVCRFEIVIEEDGKDYKEGGRFLNMWKKPDFTVFDFIENAVGAVYAFEVSSDFPPDSVRANFERMADSRCPNTAVSGSLFTGLNGMPREGDRYCIEINDVVHPVDVKCFPYRRGAKCIVNGAVLISKRGGNFSAVEGSVALRNAVEKIVND